VETHINKYEVNIYCALLLLLNLHVSANSTLRIVCSVETSYFN